VGDILRDVGFTDMLPDVYWLTLFTIGGLVIASVGFTKNLD
jgi:ABC-2 type transport system permease protein